MARDVQPPDADQPDADQVNALLRETDSKELGPILQVFSTRVSRKQKLIIFEQMLNNSADRRGVGRLSSSSYGLSDAKRKVYFNAIERLIQEAQDRRTAEGDAEREELSRQITPEELKKLSNPEVTLIDKILNGKFSDKRERLIVLRLIRCSTGYSDLTSSVWQKWDSIAAAGSDQVVDDVSQAIHKEWTGRDLDVSKVLNADT